MEARLQVSLSAHGLRNLAGFRNTSDPFAVLSLRGEHKDDPPTIVGQTEVEYNNLKPQWGTVITLDGFNFGVPMFIEVGIFDFNAKLVGANEAELALHAADHANKLLSTESTRGLLKSGKLPHKVMGTALFEVGSILGSRGNVQSKSLQTGGAVFVHIERSRNDGLHGRMKFQLRGINLTNIARMGRKINPYFHLYRKVDRPSGATWIKVHRSNVVKSNVNPKWEATELDLELTCNGDMNRAMKVVVYDHRNGGRHRTIGEFETSMGRFVEAKNDGGDVNEDRGFTLIGKNGKVVGHICILQAAIYESQQQGQSSSRNMSQRPVDIPIMRATSRVRPRRPEFIDYVLGGCEISLAVAIDFTASNGNPHEPGTPHHFHPPESGQWNDYQKAIFAVGTILAKYDTDQKFPVWGFGAKYNGVIRNCFQCGDNVEVKGVTGILDAYQGVFNTQLTMSYPTVFTEVIGTAAGYAKHEQENAAVDGNLSYTILLILTAGNLRDEKEVRETKSELIAASDSPLSVVIVGIGDNDFEGMTFLDEHDPEKEGGRDITKFVRFTEYKSYNLLTEAVLDEIPEQLVDYYYERGVMPKKAESVDRDGIEQLPADSDDRTVQFLG